MANKYQIENGLFVFERKPDNGCVYFLFSFIGVFLITGGCIGLIYLIAAHNPLSIKDIFVLVLFFVGFLFLWTSVNSPAKGFYERIEFDNKAKILRFIPSSLRGKSYDIPYGVIAALTMNESLQSNGSSKSSKYSYQIFVVRTDGSTLWISTFFGKSDCESAINELSEYTGFTVQDTKDGIEKKAKHPYKNTGKATVDQHSEFIKIKTLPDGSSIELEGLAPKGITKIVLIVFFACMLCFPALIFYYSGVLEDAIFTAFGIFFFIFFYGILFIVLLSQVKRYVVKVNSESIEVRMVVPLATFLSTRITVSREDIYAVRLNRAEEGHFRLIVAAKKRAKGLTERGVLFAKLGAYDTDPLKMRKDEWTVPLWEISVWNKIGRSPTVFDLEVLEKYMDNVLAIEEQ